MDNKDTLFVFTHALRKELANGFSERGSSSKKRWDTRIEDVVAHNYLFVEPKLDALCTFLSGYDAALGGAAMVGLTQWLILKKRMKKVGVNHWTRLLTQKVRDEAGKSASEPELIKSACAVLSQFFAYRRRYGVNKLCADFNAWRGYELLKRTTVARRSRSTKLSSRRSKTRAAKR